MSSPDADRVRAIIDRLSERLDDQTLLPCADMPHLVAIVGSFHRLAGKVEAKPEPIAVALVMIRTLRNGVATHSILRQLAEMRKANAETGPEAHRRALGDRRAKESRSDDPGR